MAEIVQIQGSEHEGKIRNPLGVVGLTIITLGVYFWFWYYKINKEMAEIGRVRNTEECGTSPGTSLLAVTLGCFIIVPPFVSIYKTWSRKSAAGRLVGGPEGMEPGLGWLLTVLISPVGHYILQSDLNKVLQAQAGGAGALPPQATSIPQPAPQSPEQPI